MTSTTGKSEPHCTRKSGVPADFLDAFSASRRRNRQAGFTFIETAVAVVVLLALLAVAVPRLAPAADDVRLQTSAAALSGLAVTARHTSVLEKRTCFIECAADANRCDLSCEPPATKGAARTNRVKVRSCEWKYGGPARAAGGNAAPAVTFFPDGSARGPALELSGPGGRKIAIEIFSATALPYVYEPEKK